MCNEAIISLYERHARDFDRDRSRSLQEKAWLDRFLSHVRPSGTVLDLGCGMAESIARYLWRGTASSILHTDDQRAMFARFAAHALPGAPLMFTSGPSEGQAIGSYRDEPLYHASLDPAGYEQLLAANGFSVRAYLPDDPECGQHTVWLATYDATAPS